MWQYKYKCLPRLLVSTISADTLESWSATQTMEYALMLDKFTHAYHSTHVHVRIKCVTEILQFLIGMHLPFSVHIVCMIMISCMTAISFREFLQTRVWNRSWVTTLIIVIHSWLTSHGYEHDRIPFAILILLWSIHAYKHTSCVTILLSYISMLATMIYSTHMESVEQFVVLFSLFTTTCTVLST